MPATRPHVERDAKAAEILDAAEPMLLRDGYEATTMAAIAKAAGVSPNAVYWYFPGKDELLAAVLRRRHERAFACHDECGEISMAERAEDALRQIDELGNLAVTIHERAKHSPVLAEVHEQFHAELARRGREGFEAGGLDPEQARLATEALIAMVEGVHLHDEERDPASRDELVMWAIARFLDGA